MNAQAPVHNGHTLYPAPVPRLPVRPAPARMGIAGISAGAEATFKTSVPPPPRCRPRPLPIDDAERLADGLGYFSLALGAAEVLAPRAIGGALGLPIAAPVIRGYGAREIGAGLGILTAPTPQAKARWVWGRVVGDVLDLATLAAGLGDKNPKRGNLIGAIIAVGAITVLDVVCAVSLGKAASPDAARPGARRDRDDWDGQN